MKNLIGWAEIPVEDMDRAQKFYEKVFDVELEREMIEGSDNAWFPWDDDEEGAGASLIKDKDYMPSKDGILVYFKSPSGDLDEDLKRIEEAGGKIVQGKMSMGEDWGMYAVFMDTEGNKLAISQHKK